MTQVVVDVVIVIVYNFEDASKSCIYTNARTDNDAIEDILSSWIQNQIGQGADPSPRVERDVYTVRIGLVIEDDSFCTESDTGNRGLTAGIVMAVLGMLPRIPMIDSIAIKPLHLAWTDLVVLPVMNA